MLQFKENVKIKLNRNEFLLFALCKVEEIFEKRGIDAVVTSGNDSKHSKNSFHYKNLAFDVRTNDLFPGLAEQILRDLKAALYVYGFDVLLEDKGKPNEHIHVEFDPR
jgi:hypothetical protein